MIPIRVLQHLNIRKGSLANSDTTHAFLMTSYSNKICSLKPKLTLSQALDPVLISSYSGLKKSKGLRQRSIPKV